VIKIHDCWHNSQFILCARVRLGWRVLSDGWFMNVLKFVGSAATRAAAIAAAIGCALQFYWWWFQFWVCWVSQIQACQLLISPCNRN
jgi:hypothetical protein